MPGKGVLGFPKFFWFLVFRGLLLEGVRGFWVSFFSLLLYFMVSLHHKSAHYDIVQITLDAINTKDTCLCLLEFCVKWIMFLMFKIRMIFPLVNDLGSVSST